MSKIDDIRRQQEAEHARNKQPADGASPKVAKVIPIRPLASVPAAEANDAARAIEEPVGAKAAEEGKCAHCGKVRPLMGGLVGQHQKGLNKLCPGSRKKPA